MALFSYSIKDKEGTFVKGTLEAESKEKLIEHFHKEGCIIFSITESRGKPKKLKRGKIKIDDLVVFSRQFTTLIESGIPVVEALDILNGQVESPTFKEILNIVLRDVKEGESLASALAKHPKAFPELYISMVEAAEVSGNLSEILNRVSIYLEKSSALRKKVIASLYYPVIIIVMAVAITGFLILKVIPTFKGIFEMLGGTLPLPTLILIKVSDILRHYFFFIVVFSFVGFSLFVRYINTPKGKLRYHRMLLRLPVIGGLVRLIAIAKFSRTFATLTKSGVAIIKCLEIVAKTSGNKVIEEAVMKSKKFIQEGQPISLPLEGTGIFPVMVIKMISIGEKSGRLEEMLSKIAQFYEEQTDAMVSGLSSIIEPVVIAFLGIVIGGIVVALFLPILKITEYLGG